MSRNSNTDCRAFTTSSERVSTTIPSVHWVEQAVCIFGIFSMRTMHTRQEPSTPSAG